MVHSTQMREKIDTSFDDARVRFKKIIQVSEQIYRNVNQHADNVAVGSRSDPDCE